MKKKLQLPNQSANTPENSKPENSEIWVLRCHYESYANCMAISEQAIIDTEILTRCCNILSEQISEIRRSNIILQVRDCNFYLGLPIYPLEGSVGIHTPCVWAALLIHKEEPQTLGLIPALKNKRVDKLSTVKLDKPIR